MQIKKRIVLAAGGTGGHVFPAVAVAEKLLDRGYPLCIMTDGRGAVFWKSAGFREGSGIKNFKTGSFRVLPSGGLVTGSPLKRVTGVLKLGAGYVTARRLLRQYRPGAVMGFGGYPCVPPLLAAQHKGIPTVVHEQNSVMGKANRLTARNARRIALSFGPTHGVPEQACGKAALTGNPVRAEIAGLSATPYRAPGAAEKFNLLVMGGSLGAGFLSGLIPAALALLDPAQRNRLTLCQQVRPEDLDRVAAKYEALGMGPPGTKVSLAPFITDVAGAIGRAGLIICRAGATGVCEVAAAGRPALFIPLDIHADRHQVMNAGFLSDRGAAWSEPQSQTSPEALAFRLSSLMNAPGQLEEAAGKAARLSRPDATDALVEILTGPIAD